MHKITVIIPIYNSENYLNICLESIVNQTYTNIQIILIDDGSSDKSGLICDLYAEKDERIEVYHRRNEGVSNARNYAIKKAFGEYILFVDSDDEINIHMVEELYNNMKKYNADIVICGHSSIYIDRGVRKAVDHIPPEFNGNIRDFLKNIESFLDVESIQGPCGKLFSTNLIKYNNIEFPKDLNFGEDTFFIYNYLSFCSQIISLPKSFYYYNKRNENSLCSTFKKDKIDIYLDLYEELETLLNKYDIININCLVQRKIYTSVIACLGEMYTPNNKIPYRMRINILKTTFENKKTLLCFKSYNNFQNSLIFILGTYKLFLILDYYFKIKELMRNTIFYKKILKKLNRHY